MYMYILLVPQKLVRYSIPYITAQNLKHNWKVWNVQLQANIHATIH